MNEHEAKCPKHGFDLCTNLWFEDKCADCEKAWGLMNDPRFDPNVWRQLAREVEDKG